MVTRRALLASTALLAGCGGAEEGESERASERPGGVSSLADVALLNDALALERRVAERFPRLRERAERHVALIEAAIRRARGEIQPLAPGSGASDAVAAQDELVALYVDYLPKLSEPRLRGEVGLLLGDAAGAAAELRAAAGEDPAPRAFVVGARPEEQGG